MIGCVWTYIGKVAHCLFAPKGDACSLLKMTSSETIENRLAELERRIYGAENKKQGQGNENVVVPKLASMAQEVGDAIGKHERVVPLFRRLTELEKYLEPSAATETGLSLDARAALILCEEERLRQTNHLLEQISEKKTVLDSQTLKDAPSMEGKLLELTKIHLDQSQRCDEWSDEYTQGRTERPEV